MNQSPNVPKLAVIGAGAAGLAALYEFRERGWNVECFEGTSQVGGHWHHDYEALHLITGRDVTGYDHAPMPKDYPLFPSRDQVARYLCDFAESRGLIPAITFNTRVLEVSPIAGAPRQGGRGWRVKATRGDEGIFDAVVVANGHLHYKRLPALAEDFTGTSIHSSEYSNVVDIDGQRVLVVGAGNSGCDLAVDAAQARLDVTISMRSGRIFQPKTFHGKPRSELRELTRLTPWDQDEATRALIEVVLGTWRDYPGMQKPNYTRLADGQPVVNTLLPYWIQHGRVQVRPEIERIEGKYVEFSNGTREEFDTILWATGFQTTLPFLDRGLLDWDGVAPDRVGAGTVPVGVENLYLVGLVAPRGPQIAVYPHQARLIARMVQLKWERGEALDVERELRQRQEPERRIDVLRHLWDADVADTQRWLDALEAEDRVAAVLVRR